MTDLSARRARDTGFLTVTTQRIADRCTISLAGELDLASIEQVDDELLDAEASDARCIVLDLSQLEFVDSQGIRLLLTADARSRADSNRLRLIRPPERVMRVFRIADVERMLPFED